MRLLTIGAFVLAIVTSTPNAGAQTDNAALRTLLPPELISRLIGNGAGFLKFERNAPRDGTNKEIVEAPMFTDDDWRRIIDEMDRIDDRADKQVADLLKSNSSALWELLLSKTGPTDLKQSAEILEWDRLTAEITIWSVRLAKYYFLYMIAEPSKVKTADKAMEDEYSNMAIPYERNARVFFRYLLESPKLVSVLPKRFDIERLRRLDAKTLEMRKRIAGYGWMHTNYLYSGLTEIRGQPSVLELVRQQEKLLEPELRTLEQRANYSRLDRLRADGCDGYARLLDLKSAEEANGNVSKTLTAEGKPVVAGSTDHLTLYSFILRGCTGPKKFELARKVLDEMVAALAPDADGRELIALCDLVHWSRVGIGKKLPTAKERELEERYRKFRNDDCSWKPLVNPLAPWRVIPAS